MSNTEFIKLCEGTVKEYFAKQNVPICTSRIFIIWMNKTLNTNKASVYVAGTKLRFEVTFEGATNRLFMDIYKQKERYIKVLELQDDGGY